MGTAVAQWWRCSATNRKVAGSIPAGVIGIFHWHEFLPTLGSNQPLTEMSARRIFWGKGGRCIRVTNLPPSCAVVMKSGNPNLLETSGPLQACNGTALSFYLLIVCNIPTLDTENTLQKYEHTHARSCQNSLSTSRDRTWHQRDANACVRSTKKTLTVWTWCNMLIPCLFTVVLSLWLSRVEEVNP